MIESLRMSTWTYTNGATGGIGTGLLAASGGTISFTDPDKKDQDFSYAGFGIGLFSIAIPKLKIPDVPILNRGITGTGAANPPKLRNDKFLTRFLRHGFVGF